MSFFTEESETQPDLYKVENNAAPIHLTEVRLAGVAAESALPGSVGKIWVRMHLTSDQKLFHTAAKGLAGVIEYRAGLAGAGIRLDQCNCVLAVLHEDDTGDLGPDTAAVLHNILAKRPVKPGTPVFQSDVGDIIGMRFPAVSIGPTDRVICLFREGFRFGLFFDFNPGGEFDVAAMERDLGTLVRRMRYADLYDALDNGPLFQRVIDGGWFPFVEIVGPEFSELLNQTIASFPLEMVETKLLAKFDKARLDHLLERWVTRPHFASKKPLLDSAMRNFLSGDPHAVIKIVLTEIEGVLREAYFQQTGARDMKLDKLLDFAIESAEQRAGSTDTLLFPTAFGVYLRDYVFRNFDPRAGDGTAGSRHAVGHGAADAASYTMVRALQGLLTLDQLAFYTAR